jgi:hypothetical protein
MPAVNPPITSRLIVTPTSAANGAAKIMKNHKITFWGWAFLISIAGAQSPARRPWHTNSRNASVREPASSAQADLPLGHLTRWSAVGFDYRAGRTAGE